MAKLNIVVVGLGLIGPRHAEQVQQNPNAHLLAVIDPSPMASDIVQRLFPGTSLYTNVKDLINETGLIPDGAIVCTPNTTHYSVVIELMAVGVKNILVEKPMTTSIEDAIKLKINAEQHGVNLLVGHHRRFNPYIVNLKENIHRIGTVIAIDGVWMLKKNDEYFQQTPWRTDSKQGGGVILINLVHDLDLLQYLNGPIVRVYASTLPKTRHYAVDEGAVMILEFKNGSKGTFIVSDNVISPHNFEMCTGENPLIPKNESDLDGIFYKFFGTKGTISSPDLRLFHQNDLSEDKVGWWEPIQKLRIEGVADLNKAPFTLQLKHFIDVIEGKESPRCSVDDGISVMLVIKAIQKSIDSGFPELVQSAVQAAQSSKINISKL